jgi:hypothetical protein
MKIESNIPAPERKRGRPSYGLRYGDLGVGDSFEYPEAMTHGARVEKSLKAHMYRNGSKKYRDREFRVGLHEGKWRCWRVK